MNGTFWVGVILIVLGTVLLVSQGFGYNTQKTTEIIPIDVTAPEEERVYASPIIGGGMLALGLFMTFLGFVKKAELEGQI